MSYGGLDLDGKGHVLAIEWNEDSADLWVYSVCKPICTLVAENPLTNNVAFFGHLDRRSQRFAVGAYLRGQVDIYTYTPTTLTYEYSFNRGLSYTKDVGGVAYSPSSMK